MFIIAGISSKIKRQGVIASCPCPACGESRALHVMHKYMTPHVFFIPTFRFNSEYIAACESCAVVFALSKEKGRALKSDPDFPISPEDLTVPRNYRL